MHSSLPRIPFTREAYEKMQVEQEALEKELEEVLIRLKAAREMGDLSENGAYKYAKFELGRIRRRLRELKHLLEVGEIVDSPSQTDMVGFGARVVVNDGKKDTTFQVVSAYESNPLEGKISVDSPLGQALLNKKVGETVSVVTPRGEVQYRLLTIQ